MQFTICHAVCAALLSAALLPAQILPDRYIVELSDQPATTKTKSARRALVRAQHERIRPLLEARNARVLRTIENVANAIVVESADPASLARISGVKRVHPVRLYKKTLDRAVAIEKISDAWAQIGREHAGEGIKIGIIDTGVDATHPAFQDPSMSMPDGFPRTNRDSDMAWTNSKVIVARAYDYKTTPGDAHDIDGHGTAVAMIAAGGTYASDLGSITGVAPKAWIGSYKVFPDGTGGAPTDLILQALDDAVSDGMDIVNLSLGSVVAENPATDILVQAVERATQAGVLVVAAAGNDGPDADTISSPGTAPSAITVGASENDRFFAAHANVQGGASYVAFPSSTAPTAEVDGSLFDIASLDSTSLACGDLPAGSLSGKVALVLRGTCTFESKLNNVQNAGAIAAILYTDPTRPAVPMDAGTARLPGMMISNADGLALKAAGSAQMQLDFHSTASTMDYHAAAGYSGHGPSVDLSIKPDLVAVGSNILTAAPGTEHPYTVGSGTSFSSPMAAGALAILKGARPGLTVTQYRSLLINSATELLNGTAPVQLAGAGLLDMMSALNTNIVAYPTSLGYGSTSGAVDVNSPLTVTNTGTNPDTFHVTVRNASGSLLPSLSESDFTLDAGQSKTLTVSVQGTASEYGSYEGLLEVASDSGSHARVPYWLARPGNDVNAITVLYTPDSPRRNTTDTILFRITDPAGVPMHTPVSVVLTEGTSRVLSVNPDDTDSPGSYAARVRLAAGTNTFQIEAGGKTATVSLTVR